MSIARSLSPPAFAPRFSWAPLAILAFLAFVPLIAAVTDNPFLVRLFTRIVIFAIVAVALNLVLGFGGMVSMSHAALFGVGSYAVAVPAFHEFEAAPILGWPGTTNLALSAPLAIVVTAAVAAVMGLIALRTSGLYFIMITLAFNQMFFYFFSGLEKYGGSDGLQVLADLHLAGVALTRLQLYFVCWIVLALTLLALTVLVRSRFGAVITAAQQNERRLIAIGITPLAYRLLAFVFSGALCGLAGALWATSQGFVSPADMAWTRSAEFVVIAVLGGMSVVWGPVLGAIVFLSLEVWISDFTTYWQLPIGLVVIFVTVFLRGGLAGAGMTLPNRSHG